jgi:hypothetical protein
MLNIFVKEKFPHSEKVRGLPQIYTEHLHTGAVVFTLSVLTWNANPDFCHYKLAESDFNTNYCISGIITITIIVIIIIIIIIIIIKTLNVNDNQTHFNFPCHCVF